jgi:DNA-binding NarL/FixJ family response regulator
VVLLALDELGPMDVAALADADIAVLLLVRDVGGVDLGRVSSVSTVGILDADTLTVRSLLGALEQIAAGQVPIPARLAQRLLASGGAASGAKPIPRLTSREQEVLVLLVDGLSNKQIARRLAISDHGAKRLVGNILAKLDAPNRTLAVTRSLRDGLYEHCLNNGRGLRSSA